MKKLSIVIPAYNEERFIGELLEKIVGVDTESIGYCKEVVVVDDGSSDNTAAIVSRYTWVTLVKQNNQGKGAAVRNGIYHSTGDYLLVQDADLEYDPEDYKVMLTELNRQSGAVAIYGSRTMGMSAGHPLFKSKHKEQGFGQWLAGRVLSLWAWLLFGKYISDTLTAYKLYPNLILKNLPIVTNGFETDHELTCKLIKHGVQIVEVPISYSPRSVAEGKKIKARDGVIALWTFLRFRIYS